MEGGGGGWLASVAKGPSRTDAFRNPSCVPWKRVCSRIYARKTILAWPGALMRFPPSARGGMMMRWWRRRERAEATYAREFRSGTSERTGVTFRLKGKGEFENV